MKLKLPWRKAAQDKMPVPTENTEDQTNVPVPGVPEMPEQVTEPIPAVPVLSEQVELVSPFEYGDKAFVLAELPDDARWHEKAGHGAKAIALNLLYFEWTKMLVHWLIRVAGTMSECAFLIAGLWMSLNANVHPLIRESCRKNKR